MKTSVSKVYAAGFCNRGTVLVRILYGPKNIFEKRQWTQLQLWKKNV